MSSSIRSNTKDIEEQNINNSSDEKSRAKRVSTTSQKIKETCIFAMLGTLMFCSKIIMEILPNIHLLGMFIVVFTVVFRFKALIPIYIYVLLNGVYAGFSAWWVPYLYIWTVLWALTMLVPRNIPKWVGAIVYPLLCFIHGILFGTLYAPAQALLFGFDFEQTVAWIIAGLPWDVLHGVSNLFVGFLCMPLSELLKMLKTRYLK